MEENQIENRLKNGVKKLGGWCVKLLAQAITGWPDRTILLRGRVWFVELKAPGGRLSARQISVKAKLSRLGFVVRLLDTDEKVDAFLYEISTL